MGVCPQLDTKLHIFWQTNEQSTIFFVTSWSEAEEETGSAEEQPVSNRFLHYTETVFMGEGILRSALALSCVSGMTLT